MSSVQCEGTTQNGTRCRKNTKDTSKRCHNHRVDRVQSSRGTVRRPRSQIAREAPIAPIVSVPIVSSVHTYTIQTRSKRRAALASLRRSPVRSPMRVIFSPVRLSPVISPARVLFSPVRVIFSPARAIVSNELPEDRVKPRPTHTKPKKPKHAHENNSNEQDDCCVCYERMPTSDALECSHLVCQTCVKQLRDDSCPMCRATIKSKYITNRDRAKITRRKRQDAIDRANESFRNYLASHPRSPVYTGPSRVPIMLGVYHV